MVLEKIYICRHGYRTNWVVSNTGEYSSKISTPTGIPADPALASYGEIQAQELAEKLTTIEPPVDVIYSSPYYRCLQTLKPTIEKMKKEGRNVDVKVENGLGEFYGLAPFTHPSPAPLETLHTHFSFLSHTYKPVLHPSTSGESIPTLHNRLAYTLHRLIEHLDASPDSPRTLLICSHAASMIAMGRVLTGNMPEDFTDEDFRVGTCALSVFERRSGKGEEGVKEWDRSRPDKVPDVVWKGGKGVGSGWDCTANGDCSFLRGGEERTWRFSGDEAFMKDPNAYNDSANTAKESGSDSQGSGPRL